MRLFDFFKRKVKVPQLKGKTVNKLKRSPYKWYKATCVISYKGEALRQFEVTERGLSGKMVAMKIDKEMEIKCVKINQLKKR